MPDWQTLEYSLLLKSLDGDNILKTITPLDIKSKWLSVVRRLQSVAPSNGFSIIHIDILVNKEGEPVSWTSPTKTTIEPSQNAEIQNAESMLIALTDKM